jgi:LuxR family quorum sensing-dependent transcriptional regulator
MASRMYQLETSACIEELGRLSSPDEVAARLERTLGIFGCDHVIFTGLPSHRQRLQDLVVLNTFPSEFFELYVERQFVDVCPIMRQCKRSILPFEWSEATCDPKREPRAAAVMSTAADFGIARGLAIPVPIPDQNKPHRAVSLSGTRLDLSIMAKNSMHLIALYGFERLRNLMNAADEDKPALTPREREVLTWMAEGKSAWELGEILGLSARTVNEHSQTACRKLRAANRTHAVAIALEQKLIEA